MFAMGRYDPDAEEKKKRKKKTKKTKDTKKTTATTTAKRNIEQTKQKQKKKKGNNEKRERSKDESINVDGAGNVPIREKDKGKGSKRKKLGQKDKEKEDKEKEKEEMDNTNKNDLKPTTATATTTKSSIPMVRSEEEKLDGSNNGNTSDSSSSVPFSSDDSDSENNNDNDTKSIKETKLRVIAPDQGENHSATQQTIRRRKQRGTDEGIDDFDDANEDELLQLLQRPADAKTPSTQQPQNAAATELSTAVRASRLPIRTAASLWNLAPFLVRNLERNGYRHFFPVQCLVVPDVVASERHAHVRHRDVCVSAPTGSGKTLAFVLPLLNSLAGRTIVRLRALVVLPSRDLAVQVYNVFDRYRKGSNLKIGLAIGQTDFEAEQKSLILGSSNTSSFLKNDQTHLHNDDNNDGEEEQVESNEQHQNISKGQHSNLLQYAFDPFNINRALEAFDDIFSSFDTPNNNTHRQQKTPTPPAPCGFPSNVKRTVAALSPHQRGGKSAVDVLVCTPGRLLDHLDRTPGFTLQHLRFLVMDEADRLVNQSYQNWVGRVVEAANAGPYRFDRWFQSHGDVMEEEEDNEVKMEEEKVEKEKEKVVTEGSDFTSFDDCLEISRDGTSIVLDPVTWRKDGGRTGISNGLGLGASGKSFGASSLTSVASSVCRPVQLRKLLFSATMTKDPRKLASLGLVNPKHYDAHGLGLGVSNDNDDNDNNNPATSNRQPQQLQQQYSLPETLSEHTVECTAQQKPLVLLALLLEQAELDRTNNGGGNNAEIVVVFTSSLDSTHRLARLLQLLWGAAGYGPPVQIAEFSSALDQKQRARLVKRCTSHTGHKDQKDAIRVVVCSDGMSRGMDIPVAAVVNYDVPRFAKTYVHRCGRTARAGKDGRAISVVKGGQVAHFWKMRELIDRPERVTTVGVRKDLLGGVVPIYPACVSALRRVLDAEERRELHATAPLTSKWLPSLGGAEGKESNLGENDDMEDDSFSSDDLSVMSDE